MSEKLSSQGRAGAEEVTEVMNATFAALLAVAYAQGGGLLKFGGDALLLLYEGEEHASRAARAAFEMRRTLRAIGRPRTSAGAIQLKMHAGLHSGTFQFFLVGESHRELLISGPSASATVAMEADVGSGRDPRECRYGRLVEPDALGDAKGGAHYSGPHRTSAERSSRCPRWRVCPSRSPSLLRSAPSSSKLARSKASTATPRSPS